jgi:preprotein translocase subunit SecF
VNTVGPILGKELRDKAFFAIAVVVLIIIFFIAFAFRKVSKPVSSWKYGTIAIVVLVHDIMLPVGLFAIMGHFFGAEVDGLFVMALLAILGYSINDTIVVFDRIRENLKYNADSNTHEDFEFTVGKSLNQTYVRSFNTSLTTSLTLLALFFFGSESTHYFSLTLLAGVIAGTYSSIFLAAPMLVWLNNIAPAKDAASGKNKKKKKRR